MGDQSKRAEGVRRLVRESRHAMLSTHGLEPPGFPYGSLVPCACSARGEPVFLVSRLAQHTRNLRQDPRASLLFVEAAQGDPQRSPRATVVGTAHPLEGDAERDARARFLARHPAAEMYFGLDFELWALEPAEARFIGGFGAAAWVPGSDVIDA